VQSDTQSPLVSNGMLWTGWIMSSAPSLFLLVDGGMKLAKPAIVVQTTVQLGYPESVILGLGIILLVCTVLYLIPRTSVLGAILLTGYLGGAVATHVRVQDGIFPVFFPVILGALLWGGLVLRDPWLRALIPLRTV
jgi:DoxX-like family